MRNMKLLETEDGSHTLINEGLQISYHSKYGAIQESKHTFINTGLDYYVEQSNATTVNIFELGFGTGLNALLSMEYAAKNNVTINYHTVETDTVDAGTWQQLNYGTLLKLQHEFTTMHEADWGKKESYWPNFYINKHQIKFQEWVTSEKFDLVFYHPFTPNAQPELWTVEMFEKLTTMLNKNAVLVTFCCKSEVQRILRDLGFAVELPEGPPGKREILRATFCK